MATGLGSIIWPDKSGKYSEQTFVRRYCNSLPWNSLAQGKLYAVCLASKWRLSGLLDCRFAAGCDEKLLHGKLMFDDISYGVSEVVKFPEDKSAKYHQNGSKVTATCKGESVALKCADGGYWVESDNDTAEDTVNALEVQ